MSSLELIRNDLDNVDDVFAIGFGGGSGNYNQQNRDEDGEEKEQV